MRASQGNEPLGPIAGDDHPIPGYRLIKQRGRGGGAEVWEAEAPGGFRVALKIVNLATDRESAELRSLDIIRGIHHPSLLPIFGAWQVENRLIIGMDLADRSLWERFLEARSQGLCGIPQRELLGYLEAAAIAVDYLNQYRHTIYGRTRIGIQHRDLKPQNILLFGDHAKVADFGLAQVMEQSVASHTGTCTLAYAAPEFFGKKTSRQSDQYALAVTYAQLRGGRLPFQGTTAQVAVGHLLNDPDLDSLSEPERPVVAQALSKRPKDRWPDCRSFIDALKSLNSAERCLVLDTLPLQGRDDSTKLVPRVLPGPPSDPSLLMEFSDFIPMDTGGSDFPLELTDVRYAPKGPSPEGWDLDPKQHNGRSPGLDSDASLVRSQTDFIPMDTGDSAFPLDIFESAYDDFELQGAHVGLGALHSTDSSAGESPWGWDPAPPETPNVEPPAGQVPFHRVVGAARMRPDGARIGRYFASAATGLVLLTWAAQARVDRPRGSAPPTGVTTAGAAPRRSGMSQVGGSEASGRGKQPRPARPAAPALESASAWPRPTTPFPLVSPPSITDARPEGPRSGPPGITPFRKDVAVAPPAAPVPELVASWPQQSAPIPLEIPPPVVESRATKDGDEAVVDVASEEQPTATSPAVPTPESAPERSDRIVAAPPPVEVEREVVAVAPSSGHEGKEQGISPAGPPAPKVIRPEIELPATLSVRAGETANVPVHVRGVEASNPVPLEFRGLPRGLSVSSPMISAGTDRTDVVVMASSDALPGVTETTVAFTAGAERSESSLKIEVLPSPDTVAYKQGRSELGRAEYNRAVVSFAEAIRLKPDSFAAHRDCGVAYHFLRRFRDALAEYSEALRLRPGDPLVYMVRARVLLELGETTRALDDYTEAIRHRPTADALLARGQLHHDLGDYDRALSDFGAALKHRPGDLSVLLHRGLTRYHSGDNDGAILDFNEVIRHDPNYAPAYRNRGDAYARRGEWNRAGADHEAFHRLVLVPGASWKQQSQGKSGPVQPPREGRPSSAPAPSSHRTPTLRH